LGRVDLDDVFSDTRTDKSILEPSIGSFNFPFRLRRKSISDFYITILQDLFPLGGGFIGEEVVFSPDRVSSLDESEDRMRIDVIRVREPIAKDDGLEGQNMSPGGLFFDQSGIKDEAAVIIQGGDQIPFLLGRWCPKMTGRVMLDEFAGVMG
jgi:hypothetical protein